jgi:glucose-6-phosphate 1-epimerase
MSSQDPRSLQERFAGRWVRFEAGQGGLTCVRVAMPAASAEVYLHGAHVSAYQPAGQAPVLWMSRQSWFAPGRPIRGGVPICCPWFGPHGDNPQAPMHGTVRLQEWELAGVREHDDEVTLVLRHAWSDLDRQYFPHRLGLEYTIHVGPQLHLELAVANLDERPVRLAEALHAYFNVGDARVVRIHGLEHADYLDKTDNLARKNQGPAPIRLAGQTNRVYLDTPATCRLEDPALGRRIIVQKSGSATTVVWNPWIANAAAMPDFSDDEWPGMVCIETANAFDNAIVLAAGATHRLAAKITAEVM